MNIIFKTVRLVRFRSFLHETIIHFDDAGPGLYFLKGKNLQYPDLGSNDAGKSTIIDALNWCLYGKTVKGLKNPDIIPWSGKGQTLVEVILSVDKKEYSVVRTAGPNTLTLDGKEIAQAYLQTLLIINQEIVPYTIIMGQREPLFFDLSPSRKLEVFSETLNLSRWDERSEHAKNMVEGLEEEIRISTQESDLHIREVENLQKNIISMKQKSQEWEDKRQDVLAGKDQDLKVLKNRIDSVSMELDVADLKLDRAETEIKAINLENLLETVQEASSKVKSIENKISIALSWKKEFESNMERLSHGNCPTCSQTISKMWAKNLSKETKEKVAKLGIQELENSLLLAWEDFNKCSESYENNKKSVPEFMKEASEAR